MGNNPAIPRFEVYTEVIQDAVIDMMQQGNISFASGCSLTVSNDVLNKFYDDLPFFKTNLYSDLLKYQITGLTRLGIIS